MIVLDNNVTIAVGSDEHREIWHGRLREVCLLIHMISIYLNVYFALLQGIILFYFIS